MANLNKLSNNSSLQKEENIFKLVTLLKKGTTLQEIDKSLSKTPATIYKYLQEIQKAQFTNPEYKKSLLKYKPVDEFQRKVYNQWLTALEKYDKTKEDLKQFQVNNEKFYDELHYFLLCYKYISR